MLATWRFWVSSACLCTACSSTAEVTPMSEEQRLRWAERLFWDLNFLPQMGQSGMPGGGGGAGALFSLSSKHLERRTILTLKCVHQSNACPWLAVKMFKLILLLQITLDKKPQPSANTKYKHPDLLRCCVRPSEVMCDKSLWQI